MANPQLKNGHTRIANEILEALARTKLGQYEWQVLIVILRKTYGWGKSEDSISLSQFMLSTGITKQNISRTIQGLIKRCIIISRDNDIAKKYKFNKDFSAWTSLSPEIPLSPEITIVIPRDKASYSVESTTKETTTKERREDNKLTPKEFFKEPLKQQEIENWLISKNLDKEIIDQQLFLFINYWTEEDQHGKQRWQKLPTFQIKNRIITWFNRIK